MFFVKSVVIQIPNLISEIQIQVAVCIYLQFKLPRILASMVQRQRCVTEKMPKIFLQDFQKILRFQEKM